MAFFAFVGLFVAATANAVLGTMIALAALVFLFFTLLIDPGSVCSRRLAHRRASKAPGREVVICLGPLLVWVIVIACYSAATSDVLNAGCPRYVLHRTNRCGRFAIDHAMERPLTGYGFMAFRRSQLLGQSRGSQP